MGLQDYDDGLGNCLAIPAFQKNPVGTIESLRIRIRCIRRDLEEVESLIPAYEQQIEEQIRIKALCEAKISELQQVNDEVIKKNDKLLTLNDDLRAAQRAQVSAKEGPRPTSFEPTLDLVESCLSSRSDGITFPTSSESRQKLVKRIQSDDRLSKLAVEVMHGRASDPELTVFQGLIFQSAVSDSKQEARSIARCLLENPRAAPHQSSVPKDETAPHPTRPGAHSGSSSDNARIDESGIGYESPEMELSKEGTRNSTLQRTRLVNPRGQVVVNESTTTRSDLRLCKDLSPFSPIPSDKDHSSSRLPEPKSLASQPPQSCSPSRSRNEVAASTSPVVCVGNLGGGPDTVDLVSRASIPPHPHRIFTSLSRQSTPLTVSGLDKRAHKIEHRGTGSKGSRGPDEEVVFISERTIPSTYLPHMQGTPVLQQPGVYRPPQRPPHKARESLFLGRSRDELIEVLHHKRKHETRKRSTAPETRKSQPSSSNSTPLRRPFPIKVSKPSSPGMVGSG